MVCHPFQKGLMARQRKCCDNLIVKFYRTFGEANDTQKVSKTMDGPQRSLGTEQRLVRGSKAKEMGNGLPPEGSIT